MLSCKPKFRNETRRQTLHVYRGEDGAKVPRRRSTLGDCPTSRSLVPAPSPDPVVLPPDLLPKYRYQRNSGRSSLPPLNLTGTTETSVFQAHHANKEEYQAMRLPEEVVETFIMFCQRHQQLSLNEFLALCKRSHLYDSTFTPIGADILFYQAVKFQFKRMDLQCFLLALTEIANRKALDVEVIFQMVVESVGPSNYAAKPSTPPSQLPQVCASSVQLSMNRIMVSTASMLPDCP